MDLSVSYIYGEAWDLTKKHGIKVAVLVLISIIVSVGINLLSLSPDFFSTYAEAISTGNAKAIERLAAHSGDSSIGITIITTLLQYAISFAISCMTYSLLISCIRGLGTSIGESIKKLTPTTYLKFIVIECLYGLMIFLGCLLFIVPGIYLGVRFAWAPYYIVEHQEATIGQALKWSWNASKDCMLDLIGLALIALVIIAVGCVVMGVMIGIGAIAGSAGITIGALLAIALLLCLSVLISFAQAKVYCEMPCDNEDTPVSDC